MSKEIIITIIIGGAGILASIILAVVPSVLKERFEKTRTRLFQKNKDLDFFFALEDLLLDELCKAAKKKKQTLKVNLRHQIELQKGRKLCHEPNDVLKELS